MLMVEDRAPCVQVMHSVLMYKIRRKGEDHYAGKYLVKIGERQDNGK